LAELIRRVRLSAAKKQYGISAALAEMRFRIDFPAAKRLDIVRALAELCGKSVFAAAATIALQWIVRRAAALRWPSYVILANMCRWIVFHAIALVVNHALVAEFILRVEYALAFLALQVAGDFCAIGLNQNLQNYQNFQNVFHLFFSLEKYYHAKAAC
jgi:hypothetical protein